MKNELSLLSPDRYKRYRRFEDMRPSVTRIIQLCYQSGIHDHEVIKQEVINIIKPPKSRLNEFRSDVDYLISEVISASEFWSKVLDLPLPNPFIVRNGSPH